MAWSLSLTVTCCTVTFCSSAGPVSFKLLHFREEGPGKLIQGPLCVLLPLEGLQIVFLSLGRRQWWPRHRKWQQYHTE